MEAAERDLRQIFRENKLEDMTDFEILELILSYSKKPEEARRLAAVLLDTYGSLKTLLNVEVRRLLRVEGMNEQTAVLITLFHTVANKMDLKQNEKIKVLKEPDTIKLYVRNILRLKPKECFLAISLNTKDRIISSEILSEGIVNKAVIEPRNLVEMLISDKAEKAIIAHNHPNAAPKPSQKDIIVTKELINILGSIGITLEDHIIVGDRETLSMKHDTDFIEFD